MFATDRATRIIDSSPIEHGADRKPVAVLGLVSEWGQVTGHPQMWTSSNVRPAPILPTTRSARAHRGCGRAGGAGDRGGGLGGLGARARAEEQRRGTRAGIDGPAEPGYVAAMDIRAARADRGDPGARRSRHPDSRAG